MGEAGPGPCQGAPGAAVGSSGKEALQEAGLEGTEIVSPEKLEPVFQQPWKRCKRRCLYPAA